MNGVVDEQEKIMCYSSPKFRQLLIFLQQHLAAMKDVNSLKAIVFVKRRYTAKMIFHVLKIFAANKPSFQIKPDFMVGVNSQISGEIEIILQTNLTKGSLERFKRGETNLIVASNVLEEGIDLQMCNLVFMYDLPSSFRSYVQSKGRARMDDSTFVMLVEASNLMGFKSQIIEYLRVSEKLKEFLIGKSINRPEPDEDAVTKEFSNVTIKPYTTKCGAILEAIGAISLLNRYCQTLPVDAFTCCTVLFDFEVADGKFIGRLIMPSQSTIKETIVVSMNRIFCFVTNNFL